MTDAPTLPSKLDTLLESLLAAPPVPEPDGWIGPQTQDERDAQVIAILADHEGSQESIAGAQAYVAEQHRRVAALELNLAEKRKPDPDYPRRSCV